MTAVCRASPTLGPDAAVVFIDSFQSEETEPQTEIGIFEEFKRQADKENPRACYYVSVAYTSGTGVERNYVEGEKWARKAAETGLSSGTRHLGLYHQLGQGVPVNRVEAQKWYYVAEGLEPKEEPLLSVINGKKMTEAELADARAQADAWLAANLTK